LGLIERSFLFSLVISFNLTLLYAVIAQLLVFLRTQSRDSGYWHSGRCDSIAPVILGLLSLYLKISWSVAVYTLAKGVDRTVPPAFSLLLGGAS